MIFGAGAGAGRRRGRRDGDARRGAGGGGSGPGGGGHDERRPARRGVGAAAITAPAAALTLRHAAWRRWRRRRSASGGVGGRDQADEHRRDLGDGVAHLAHLQQRPRRRRRARPGSRRPSTRRCDRRQAVVARVARGSGERHERGAPARTVAAERRRAQSEAAAANMAIGRWTTTLASNENDSHYVLSQWQRAHRPYRLFLRP